MKKSLITYLAAMLPCVGLFAADPSHSTSDKLKGAREELNTLLERYTEKHPAVIAKRMQITELEKPKTSSRELAKLQKAREELNTLLERYTEKHPAVIAKRMQITELEKTMK